MSADHLHSSTLRQVAAGAGLRFAPRTATDAPVTSPGLLIPLTSMMIRSMVMLCLMAGTAASAKPPPEAHDANPLDGRAEAQDLYVISRDGGIVCEIKAHLYGMSHPKEP